MIIPPFASLADNSYDVVVSFQVIEHVRDDLGYRVALAARNVDKLSEIATETGGLRGIQLGHEIRYAICRLEEGPRHTHRGSLHPAQAVDVSLGIRAVRPRDLEGV